MASSPSNQAPVLSIIIPTFNEASVIGQTLDALAHFSETVEIIVADGGSHDETAQIVRQQKARLILADRGRGAQMHAGAHEAQGKVLWFLHADTIPPPNAPDLIVESLKSPRVVGGSFNVDFDSRQISSRFLSWFYRRLRSCGLSYGDSAIFVRREAYEQIGGFKPLAIFEDLDLVRRLKSKGCFAHLPAVVTTSSRRFAGRSFTLTFARWMLLQTLYWIGVSPQSLSGLYSPIRNSKH